MLQEVGSLRAKSMNWWNSHKHLELQAAVSNDQDVQIGASLMLQ